MADLTVLRSGIRKSNVARASTPRAVAADGRSEAQRKGIPRDEILELKHIE
jgi:hypothetical protein